MQDYLQEVSAQCLCVFAREHLPSAVLIQSGVSGERGGRALENLLDC